MAEHSQAGSQSAATGNGTKKPREKSEQEKLILSMFQIAKAMKTESDWDKLFSLRGKSKERLANMKKEYTAQAEREHLDAMEAATV